MGLDFLNTQDKNGAALYIIYDGTHRQQKHWDQFILDLAKKTQHQALLLSVKDREGEKLRSFYGYSHAQLPVVFIVLDDDQVAHCWVGSEIVTTQHAAQLLNQISAA